MSGEAKLGEEFSFVQGGTDVCKALIQIRNTCKLIVEPVVCEGVLRAQFLSHRFNGILVSVSGCFDGQRRLFIHTIEAAEENFRPPSFPAIHVQLPNHMSFNSNGSCRSGDIVGCDGVEWVSGEDMSRRLGMV
ncbi:MAG: hypothetical protein KDJ26_08335 [Alphaproteobacteria bacterium]|nr:hypothetical protein [Alphaproteobacteria bacterium]MCB9985172.1 hypothetical protein [Micavibrio sp.]HPQ50686.1 hypothetical protein [Alphaproteobacteria bacterium]